MVHELKRRLDWHQWLVREVVWLPMWKSALQTSLFPPLAVASFGEYCRNFGRNVGKGCRD